MTVNKLVIDCLEEEDYALIAIHSSIEAYKLAYFLNKLADLKLKRTDNDVDFNYPEGVAYFPLFDYFSDELGCCYYLVKNTYTLDNLTASGNNNPLFIQQGKRKVHLLQQFKQVDYFLKIEDYPENISIKKLIQQINAIPHVVTAYQLELENVKATENLIFN